MAFTNHGFERRQRDEAKRLKREAKLAKKQARRLEKQDKDNALSPKG
jgi:hypothetical protein